MPTTHRNIQNLYYFLIQYLCSALAILRTGQLLVAKEGDLFMQVRRAEGLHDIAHSAVSIALFQLGALCAGGDKDDRDMSQVWLCLNGVRQLVAITDRHRNIGKNEIWP